MNEQRSVAYFSMEIGLEERIPTYSGGLGILAGDTLRSAADLKVPMVAVSLLYRKGYFRQKLEADGWQREERAGWVVEDFLEEMPQRTWVTVEGRTVHLRSWKYEVKGTGGFTVPVFFLDSDLSKISEWDRTLTHFPYGGDQHYRLCQEVILGIGGVRMLRALGYDKIERFHMNEGHSSLLTLQLLDEGARQGSRELITHEDIVTVREKRVFTTHTPVPAGHDQFSLDLVNRVLGHRQAFVDMKDIVCCQGLLNMTYLALNLSRYINGVAKKHEDVSRPIFAGHTIDAITNGVHAATWVSRLFQELYNRYIPGWREDNFSLRYALSIPKDEIWEAHQKVKG